MWRGEMHAVIATGMAIYIEDRGKTYSSLSRIAREITGTQWSGPLFFGVRKTSHRNNVQLGKFGRNRTNVWQYPGVNTLSRQGEEGNLLALHPTVKPVSLVADALLDCTRPSELVLDSFLGSGSTLIASGRTGRTCYGIELDPDSS